MTPLAGRIVRIRRLENEDRRDLFKWWSDPDSLGEFTSSALQSYTEFEKYLDGVAVGQHRSTILIIERLEDNSKVGSSPSGRRAKEITELRSATLSASLNTDPRGTRPRPCSF